MTTEPKCILLLGAGELGLAILSSISTLPNTSITLAVRSPAKYAHLSSPSINVISLDLTSPSTSLVSTFATYTIILSCTGFTSTPCSMTKLATEILDAGKLRKQRGESKLWFFPWQWGVDYDITGDGGGLMPLFGEQKAVRDLLREEARDSEVKWTVVSTGIFMSFLFEPLWGVVDREREEEGQVTVRCLRDWQHGVTVTDVQDIGRVVKTILGGEVEAEDKVLYVAGDSVSYRELADVVEKVSGQNVVREAWSIEYLQDKLSKDPQDGIRKYRLVFSGDGVFWEKAKTVNHRLGMDMMDVETYAKRVFEQK